MKEKFPEFYPPKKDDFKTLWAEAIFVFDTNVLLSLYRYPPKTQAKLVTALKKLKNRLWIPHQVALEFHRRRLSVICTQEKTYKEMLESLSSFEEQYIKHPFLQDKVLMKAIKAACVIIRNKVETLDDSRPKWLVDDSVLDNLEKLIGNKVGDAYDDAKMSDIYKEGSERYLKEIPPGYKDTEKDKGDKTKTRKYGDLIIWYQIIDKAKIEKKPIIFITDEQKEDWWWKEEGGRNMGARHELKKEMLDKAGVQLHMYQSDQFIDHSQEHLNTKFSAEFITDIKKIREEIVNDINQYVGTSDSSSLQLVTEESNSLESLSNSGSVAGNIVSSEELSGSQESPTDISEQSTL